MKNGLVKIRGRVPVNRFTALQLSTGEPDPLPGEFGEKLPRMIGPKKMSRLKAQESFVDLTGQVFGNAKVIGLSWYASAHGRPWICECACGRYFKAQRRSLTHGKVDRCDSCSFCEAARNGEIGKVHRKSSVRDTQTKTRSRSRWFGLRMRDAPPMMLPNEVSQLVRTGLKNLAGRKLGKLQVEGLSTFERGGRNRSLLWVCRCDCGSYIFRTGESLLAETAPVCELCEPTGQASRARQRARLRKA